MVEKILRNPNVSAVLCTRPAGAYIVKVTFTTSHSAIAFKGDTIDGAATLALNKVNNMFEPCPTCGRIP